MHKNKTKTNRVPITRGIFIFSKALTTGVIAEAIIKAKIKITIMSLIK